MEQNPLLSLDMALIGVGVVVTAAVWLYAHFSTATKADQARRVATVGTLVSYAYHATVELAAKTDATWDDKLAAILGRVDQVLRAQGEVQLDPGEKAKAALQIAALTGAQRAGTLVTPTLPTTPR